MADEAALLNAVVLSMGEGVVVVDAESNLLMLNPATERLLPGGVEWLTGNRRVQGATVTMADRQTLIPLEDLPVARALRGERTDDLDVMVPGTGEDGPCLRLSGWPMRDADGAVTGAVLTLRDVTDRLRERESAGEAEERFRLTFEDAPVGIALVAVGESGGELLQVNRALAALTGRSVDELTGLDIQELVADEDADREATLRARLLSGEMSSSEQELRFKGANGLVWVQASSSVVRDARGRARYAIVQLRDASQRKRFEERLQHLADHDSLTGLLNRRRLQDELVAHEQRCRRFGAAGSLLLLDLDGFKDVNDTLGHLVGDQVLRNVAAVLAERLRETDAVARLGGDEFAILLPRTEEDAALALAKELTRRVQTSSGAGVQVDVHVTASVGVAPFAGDDAENRDILAEADVALYEAKEKGRGQVAPYTPRGQQQRIATRLTWAHRIREALEEDQFVLLGQPIFDFATQRVTQHELLLRLRMEDDSLALPGDFLPVAEHFGTIREIDSWVLRAAVGLLEARPDLELLHVNVSTASLADEGFAAELKDVLDRSAVDPRRLVLEITETAAISHMERASALASQVQSSGHGLALDDFGAGFASFYYLKHLPVDLLKIDGEFVKDLASSDLSRTVVQAIVQVAHSLGRRTVAECVEDEAAYDLLRGMGVDAAQGWHIGHPAPLPPRD